MEIQLVNNPARGTKIIVDEKHLKTVPINLSGAVNETSVKNLNITSKRLSEKDRRSLKGFDLFNKWKSKLSVKEKHVFELIKNAYPVEKFTVNNRQEDRYEILLNTHVKITVPIRVFNSLQIKESSYHSNY